MLNTIIMTLDTSCKTYCWVKGHHKFFECCKILAKFKVRMRAVEQNTEDCLSSTCIINNLKKK